MDKLEFITTHLDSVKKYFELNDLNYVENEGIYSVGYHSRIKNKREKSILYGFVLFSINCVYVSIGTLTDTYESDPLLYSDALDITLLQYLPVFLELREIDLSINAELGSPSNVKSASDMLMLLADKFSLSHHHKLGKYYEY